jgi:N-acetylglucosaminyldiphosphoundecaprenol N-acetyl-beta-D-mannosaminyltransferase
MLHKGKVNVLGILVDAIDYEAAVEQVMAAAKEGRPFALSASAVHSVMTGHADPQHKYRLNQFDLLVPDGQPVRWAINRLSKAHLRDRVYGPELTLRLCERAARERLPVFFFGSSAEVLAALKSKLEQRFPDLIIAGVQPSRFRKATPQEIAQDLLTIRESGAKITFAGLGCPRQEIWAYEMRGLLRMPVIAVGAAFDFHAGTLSMAPRLMQASGLEWLYRMFREPKRLWRRYMTLNPLYATLFLLQYLRIFKPSTAGEKPAGLERFG